MGVARAVCYAAAVVLAAPVAAQDTLPNFTFRDAVAGATGKLRQFGSCRRDEQPETLRCMDFGSVAGVSMEFIVATTYRDRLSRVGGMFDTDDFDKMAAAFTEKYGRPCETRTVEVQTALSGKIPSLEHVWCFKTGKLTLSQRRVRINEGAFEYVDDWQTPAPPAKVDF